jgi:hypothetical protein
MIIKVPNFGSGWKLFDNFTHVEYSFMDELNPMEIFKYKIIDEKSKKRLMHIHANNGDKCINIATNKTCFILNDDGKTVEKLN